MYITKYDKKITFYEKEIIIPTSKVYPAIHFIDILDFIKMKGLYIEPPTIIDGWDATFIQKYLKDINDSAIDFKLFIHMRESKNIPIELDLIISSSFPILS